MSKVSSECDQKRVEHIMLKAQVGVRGVGTLPVFSVMTHEKLQKPYE